MNIDIIDITQQYIIDRQKLNILLKNIIEKNRLFAPVNKNDTIVFDFVSNTEEIVYHNTVLSPKNIIFPQTEKMFNFKIEKQKINFSTNETSDKKNIIFGIHPCDAKSLKILDKLFINDYIDI